MCTSSETRICPFCKEEINKEAIKCKHCSSALAPEKPGNNGTCPFCKEAINKEAIKCKHCGSDLGKKTGCGCGCDEHKLLPETLLNDTGGNMAARLKLPGMFNNNNFPLAASGDNCVYKLACVSTPWGAYCWLQKCCFSEGTGKWGCIDLSS